MAPRIASLLVVALAGCSPGKTRGSSEGQTNPGEVIHNTTIRTSDSEFLGGSGLTLVALPDFVRYEVNVNGNSSAVEQWAMVMQLDADTVQAGHGSARVEDRPAAIGVASLYRKNSTGSFTWGTAGTLAFELSKGRISGAVTAAVPESLNATFEGVLNVTCYLPGDGVYDGGSVMSEDGGPAPVLEIDETLENPACESVRPWAPAK
jgi:hypothetical protein